MKVLRVVLALMLLSSGFWLDVKHFGIAAIGYGAYSVVHDGHVVSGVIIIISGMIPWLLAAMFLPLIEDERVKKWVQTSLSQLLSRG